MEYNECSTLDEQIESVWESNGNSSASKCKPNTASVQSQGFVALRGKRCTLHRWSIQFRHIDQIKQAGTKKITSVGGWVSLSALSDQKLLRADLIQPDVHSIRRGWRKHGRALGLLSSKWNITRCCRKSRSKSSEGWFTLTGQWYQYQPRIHIWGVEYIYEELNICMRMGWIVSLFYSGLSQKWLRWESSRIIISRKHILFAPSLPLTQIASSGIFHLSLKWKFFHKKQNRGMEFPNSLQ